MAGERILVVEDEPAVARGLTYALKADGFEPVWVDNGQQALEVVRRGDARAVLLDIRLPGISGFDVCRQMRAEGLRLPIIMLTARDDEIDKIVGLELGADDYVVKPFSVREVTTRLRAQLRRAYGELANTAIAGRARFGNIEVDWDRLLVFRDGRPVNLTPTEFRLLKHLITNADRPISREALVEAVWGYASDIEDDRTIDVHIRHLREKLEDNPAAPRHILTARGIGYRFKP